MTAIGLLYLAMTVLTDLISAGLYAATDIPEVAYIRYVRDGIGLGLAAVGFFNTRLPGGVRWASLGYVGLIGVYLVAGVADNGPPALLVASAAQLSIPVIMTLAGAGGVSSPSGLRAATTLVVGLGAASAAFGIWDSRNTGFWTDVIAYGDFLYDVKRIQVGYNPIVLLPWNFFGFEGARRAAGLVAAPLAQGAFLSIVGVVAFASRRDRAPITAYVLLALSAFGVYQSGTRGAMLTLMLSLPLYLAIAHRGRGDDKERGQWGRKQGGRGVGLDLTLLAIGLALSFQTLAFIFSYSVGLEDGSTIGHVRALQQNLRDLPAVLIFGDGLSAAGAAAADAGLDIAGGGEGSIFSIAFQVGGPGAVIFLCFCVALARALNRVRLGGGEFAAHAAALIALLLSSAIHFVSSEIALSVSAMGSFWILAGAAAAYQSASKRAGAAAEPANQPPPKP